MRSQGAGHRRFLGPDDLPCEWLRALATAGNAYLNATASELDDGLAALHCYSLVEIADTDTVSVHRVIQAATRRTAPRESCRRGHQPAPRASRR